MSKQVRERGVRRTPRASAPSWQGVRRASASDVSRTSGAAHVDRRRAGGAQRVLTLVAGAPLLTLAPGP